MVGEGDLPVGTLNVHGCSIDHKVGTEMDQVLKGQVGLITGGAGGIGSIFGRELARRGAAVVLADLNGDGARQQAEAIGGRTHPCRRCRVWTSPTDPRADGVVRLATERFGGVDILINTAALMAEIPHSPLSDFPSTGGTGSWPST